jgi:2OG-Fe(II) oxygenase superfamily
MLSSLLSPKSMLVCMSLIDPSPGSKGAAMMQRLVVCLLLPVVVTSWIPSHQKVQRSSCLLASKLTGVVCSGVKAGELNAVKQALTFSCQEQMVPFDISGLKLQPTASSTILGSTGRVLLMEFTGGSPEEAADLAMAISQEIDEIIFEQETPLKHPILISLESNLPKKPNSKEIMHSELNLEQIVQKQVDEFEMKVPLPQSSKPRAIPTPTLQIEVDGAMVTHAGENFWDTSSILVFDAVVDDTLRSRLLKVVNGIDDDDDHNNEWDDVANGPNPDRWIRGGLVDIPDQEEDRSFGLSEDGIEELCFEHHDAVEDFEMILSSLFSDFLVSRLPEAVFGSSVSPMTANAPTSEDSNTTFQFHIDGDPNQTPPSPWTDVFGRYPNRAPGKPRFMSCLVYLNDDWNEDWGAPTRFLDVATDTPVDIMPKPGRIVLMDQDITHTVTPPNKSAGKRPRYSLVWKLILHPKERQQDMKKLSGDKSWPEPTLVGSANRKVSTGTVAAV